MRVRSKRMSQHATYWPPVGRERDGSVEFGPPEQICVRWQDKAELFRDSDGREVTSSAVVFVGREVEVRGAIAQGKHDDESPYDASAREIRQLGVSPNLGGTEKIVKAWL